MTAPAHRPHRGRMVVATVAAAVLVVAGLVLLATAGSNRSGDPTQAIAGAPSSTTSPDTPGLPETRSRPPVAMRVHRPARQSRCPRAAPERPRPRAECPHPILRTVLVQLFPASPVARVALRLAARRTVLVPERLVPATPVPRVTLLPATRRATRVVLPLVVRRAIPAIPAIPALPHRATPEEAGPASVLRHGLQLSPVPLPRCPPERSRCLLSRWGLWEPGRAARSPTESWSRRPIRAR